MIMNRLNRENLNEYITKEMEFKVQKPFLLYKNSSGKWSVMHMHILKLSFISLFFFLILGEILGIWFNNPEKCAKVGEHIARYIGKERWI